MAPDEKLTPDREDFDQVRDEYCTAQECTLEQYSLALIIDKFAAKQYRLAQERKLKRVRGERHAEK